MLNQIGSNKVIFTITAPSGAGKDSVGGKVMQELNIPEIISTTTREPRVGEINGVDYHFIKHGDIHQSDFVEHVEYSGNYYGLTKKAIEIALHSNDIAFCIVDVNGLKQLKSFYGDKVKSIFIDLPGKTMEEKLEVMKSRMKSRGDTKENIEKRIINAISTNELENRVYCDYVVVNEEIEDTKRKVKNIVSEFIEFELSISS